MYIKYFIFIMHVFGLKLLIMFGPIYLFNEQNILLTIIALMFTWLY